MTLIFALTAAINGSTGSWGHAVPRALATAPRLTRPQPGGTRNSHPSRVAAQGALGTLLRKRLEYSVA